MTISQLILNHYIMLAEIAGLWLMLDTGVHVSKKTITATRGVMLLILLEAVLWSLEQWTQTFSELSLTRPMLTATIYLLHPMILVGIMDMAQLVTEMKVWITAPIIISVPLLYTSQWTHFIFWYDEANRYHADNAILALYPYILFFVYTLIFFYFFSRRFSLYYRRARHGILYCTVFAMLGVVAHLMVGDAVDYSTIFASVLILYYLFLYMNTSRMDTLTGLMNRQCYYADSQKGSDRISCVVSVDMNDLKQINDGQGHAAGDEALRTVAGCLVHGAGREKNVYRIGGDEFAIFYYAKDENFVRADIEKMRERLSQTEYKCAFGYQMVKPGEAVENAMRDADKLMYKNKTRLKETRAKQLAAHREATIQVMHEALHSGMWGMEFDEDGRMKSVDWSPQFRKMLGYTDEKDFPNVLESWSDLLHPDDKSRVLKAFIETIEDYSNQTTYDVEYRLLTKNNGWKWFHAIGRLLRRENGVPLSYVGMFVELTGRRAEPPKAS